VLNIMTFADRNFMVCGGPTHRCALYVRRLVEAGHKVGVVRQTETAALKAAGDSRSKVFERKLSAVYTRATIAAGVALDGGDAAAPGGDAAARPCSYLVVLSEAPPASGSSGAQLALVAVETATGDVVCGAFRDGPLRSALESHLLTLEPSEVLLAGPLGAPTEKLVAGLFGAAAAADGSSGSGGGGGGGARVERAGTDALQHGAALAELTDLYTSAHEAGGGGGGGSTEEENEAHMRALLALPELVCVALAAAARHLAAFGLGRVLCRAASFRSLDSAATMTLPPNALRQLEVLAPSGGGATGARGSLLWLLDHARTPMVREKHALCMRFACSHILPHV
jgi:DNA mismatch repair protein MSH3